MAHHKVGESVKDVEGKSCDEVEEEPGAEVVHLVGQPVQILKPLQILEEKIKVNNADTDADADVHRNFPSVGHHLPLLVHKRCPEVEENICKVLNVKMLDIKC